MKSLIFCALLSLALLGCEEIEEASLGTCLSLYDQCENEIVPPMSWGYCVISVWQETKADGQDWEECELFRRGSVCACLTPVCVSIFREQYYQTQDIDEMEMLSDLLNLACPDLDAYDYN